MFHRTGNACLPVFHIRTVKFLATIRISQFQYATESRFLTDETFVSMRSDNLVCPPTRSDLGSELVLGACTCLERIGHIVSKRATGLHRMSITRLHELLTYQLSIHIDFIDTQTGRHPLGRSHLLFVLDSRNKPTGTIGCPVVHHITGLSCNDRSIYGRNPLGCFPRRCIECICPCSVFGCGLYSATGQ